MWLCRADIMGLGEAAICVGCVSSWRARTEQAAGSTVRRRLREIRRM